MRRTRHPEVLLLIIPSSLPSMADDVYYNMWNMTCCSCQMRVIISYLTHRRAFIGTMNSKQNMLIEIHHEKPPPCPNTATKFFR